MNTFLPYADYKLSAKVLDNKRLGKQRVEAIQILDTLTNGSRWENHPAVKMWRGHTNALVLYTVAICEEWVSRGYTDTCKEKALSFYSSLYPDDPPNWFGLRCFHESHRSNLKRKDLVHYAEFADEPNLPYCWPSNGKLRFKRILEPSYLHDLERNVTDEIECKNWDWSSTNYRG